MGDVVLVSRAYAFAAERHTGQFRKGKKKEAYINHPIEVAGLVTIATTGKDHALIAAAVLHDTVEDTTATLADVGQLFNAKVASLVAEVTDDKSLEKTTRRKAQVDGMRIKSDGAKMIKIADKISNLRGIRQLTHEEWPLDKQEEYLTFSREVVDAARGANAWLESVFDEVALDLEKHLADLTRKAE